MPASTTPLHSCPPCQRQGSDGPQPSHMGRLSLARPRQDGGHESTDFCRKVEHLFGFVNLPNCTMSLDGSFGRTALVGYVAAFI
jgi:hypothetical protein